MSHFLSSFLSTFASDVFSVKPVRLQRKSDAPDSLQVLPRCAQACNYGHCTLLSEVWFTRIVSLERKRTERSRKSFLLVLLDIEGVGESNGGYDRLTHDVLTVLTSATRETDLTGWYRNDSVVGVIFTELGENQQIERSIDSIVTRIISGLEGRLGPEKAGLIDVSSHLYPDEWTSKKPGGKANPELYPDLQRRQKSRWLHSATKRLIDIAGSTLALAALFPVFLAIAVAIRLTSKGPVLFQQERVGQFGERFTFLKFRSMFVANKSDIHEAYIKKLIAGDKNVSKNGIFKIQNDPRVTTVGRFLRKTSLDELPQFWNVLMGNMSLVGPRPPLPYEVEVYDIWHRRRLLDAKPGITGLWQVNGRSRTSFDDMVRLDLQYAQSSSLWLDLKILLKTPSAVLAGEGAY
jgi:lipopolysaccharide/colanic/teichoic acid biosynthesis glycosyltransferase